MINYHISPIQSLEGEIIVPGDKSISHRALMLASIADGETSIIGFLTGLDSVATLNALKKLGVPITYQEGQSLVVVKGVGRDGLCGTKDVLDLGNSGTAIRLLTGLLAGQKFDSTLTGDASLQLRPMGRVVKPLSQMGAIVKAAPGGTPPLTISGGQTLKGIQYVMPVASAQVKSCVLLAGIYATDRTVIHEPAVTRDHTERLLSAFQYPVSEKDGCISIEGGRSLQSTEIQVPGDISSAAFFIVAALITNQSELSIKHVGVNPTRMGIINILKMMGADISICNQRLQNGEPVADLLVKSSKLHGIAIPETQVPLAIDELPVLMVAAACAKGVTKLTGARELRVKETDRIGVMVNGLRRLGITVEEFADGMCVTGGSFHGGCVDSSGDHRIAMAFVIAGIVADDSVVINNCYNVQTSFPNFVELAQTLGVNIQVQEI